MLLKCWGKIISNLAFSTHSNDDSSIKADKEIFIRASSQQIYLPWTLFQESTKGWVPPEKGKVRWWMDKTYDLGVNIEGRLRKFPGWSYREIMNGSSTKGVGGGWLQEQNGYDQLPDILDHGRRVVDNLLDNGDIKYMEK